MREFLVGKLDIGGALDAAKEYADAGIAGVREFAERAALAGMVESEGRDLMKVLLNVDFATLATQEQRNDAIARVMAELRRRCNNNGEIDSSGIPDFRGLMIGDYLDGLDLSGIEAAPGGTAPQAWNETYMNNRIVVSGFNTYKGAGQTEIKNHILFTFRNVVCRGRMNPANTNTGSYSDTEMRAWLEGANGIGGGAFATGLKAALGGDYLYTISKAGVGYGWMFFTVWPPTEIEVFGYQTYGNEANQYNLNIRFPIYQNSTVYRCKRYNGSRYNWWESVLAVAYLAAFAIVNDRGDAYVKEAGLTNSGVSPAFCVA